MRPHLTYANVMATLGVFIALGGTSYAALKVTGKDVKNRSLTGKDIKKRSVQLNRLKGRLPAGPAGPKGEKGDKGDPGNAATVDTSQFLRTGELRVAVSPMSWEFFGTPTTATTKNPVTTVIEDADAVMGPPLPVVAAGKTVRFMAVDLCYGASGASRDVNAVRPGVVRSNRSGDPSLSTTVFDQDLEFGVLNGDGCKRYDLPAAVTLAADDSIYLIVESASGTGPMRLGRATFVFDVR